MKVLNTLRPGWDEKLYEKALTNELSKRNHRHDQQNSFGVTYEGESIGTLVPDLIVEDTVLVDANVVTDFTDAHIAQMIGYLGITGLKAGLLINFKYGTLRFKRAVR